MATKRTNKKAKSKKKPDKNTFNKQAFSIILFSFGILIGMFTIIKGAESWLKIHNVLLGLFGISAFLVAPIIIYTSVMIALDKTRNDVITKLIECFLLVLLISAVAQIIFTGKIDGNSFTDVLKIIFNDGKNYKGGGVFSLIIAYPLLSLFNKTGSAIISILLTVTFIILLTNITLIQIFSFISKPFRKNNDIDKKALNKIKQKGSNKNETNDTKNDVNIDIAKFIENTPNETKSKKNKKKNTQQKTVKADTSTIENEQEILPVHPVVSPKVTTDKLKETAKNTDNVELQQIINKAVSVKDNENKPNKTGNEIYIEKDGQTSLYEKDNSITVYKNPPTTLLTAPFGTSISSDTQNELKQNAEILVDTLKSFGVQTRIVDINRGPSVTRYELQPAAGVKVSRITNLIDDIKMSLAAKSIRIEAPIPGKAAVGIEVPNNEVDVISIREILESKEFIQAKSKIAFALGKDITGNVIIADIAKMPHVLIAGATGSGKSVCINSIIISLLYRSSPEDVRLLMIDPKMVELEVYNGIPHLLIPVVTDPRKAAGALSWAVTEMQKRYKLFADNNVRNLTGYNELARKTDDMEPLPQIVIIIDELADLMMVAAKDVEEAICRLAQLARAAGMHLVIATQRPSVDIITGVIKANIPSRIAFSVSSQIDSRTILDGSGAEKLLGRGDMLFSNYGSPMPIRVQGCFVSDKEVENVVAFVKNEITADYDENIIDEIEKNTPVDKKDAKSGGGSIDSSDEMVEKAIEILVEAGQGSTSYLQRKLKLGYARAARIMDQLEEMGVVSEQEGSKPRKVLMTKEQWLESQVSKTNSD